MTAMDTTDLPLATGSARAFARGLDRLAVVLQALGAAILAVLLVIVLTSVTLRYVFGSGFIWSEELAIWLNVVLVAVGAPLAATGPLAMRLDVIVDNAEDFRAEDVGKFEIEEHGRNLFRFEDLEACAGSARFEHDVPVLEQCFNIAEE